MKRVLLKTIMYSIIITIGCALINVFWANHFDKLLFFRTYYGGEIVEQVGFGIFFGELYPITLGGENVRFSDYILDINVKNFIMSFIVTFVISFIIIWLIDYIKKKVFINKKK